MTTMMVTGGTGTLGRPLVARLREEGQDVRVLSRRDPHHPVDLRKGQGLDAALAGVGTVVHVASSPMGGDDEAAGNLLSAARRAGVEHLVYISIVGVDQVPYPYYRVKHKVERMVEGSGIGWTVLRATQFHDLVRSVLRALGRPPVMLLPKGLQDQPVAVEEVAGRLAGLALGSPAGRVPDMGGPEVRDLRSLAEAWVAASGKERRMVEVPLAGRTYGAFRSGKHLAPGGVRGSVTFEEFLSERGA